MFLIFLSFAVNAVLTLVLAFAMARNHPGITEVYGINTPARRILGCVYFAIGLVSLYALVQIILGQSDVARSIAATLFQLQIIYKLATAVAVRPSHPVVIANLCVTVLLVLTLAVS